VELITPPKLKVLCPLKRYDTGKESHDNPGFGYRRNPYPFE
jgi:hypothetical protein